MGVVFFSEGLFCVFGLKVSWEPCEAAPQLVCGCARDRRRVLEGVTDTFEPEMAELRKRIISTKEVLHTFLGTLGA